MIKKHINSPVISNILFEAQNAVYEAIDCAINNNLDQDSHQNYWVKAKHVPDLVPTLNKVILDVLKERYTVDDANL